LRTAAMGTPHSGNDAEAARVIAPLGDFKVREMARRESEARGRVVRNVVRTGSDCDERGGWLNWGEP
jgi:hypothetical protein